MPLSSPPIKADASPGPSPRGSCGRCCQQRLWVGHEVRGKPRPPLAGPRLRLTLTPSPLGLGAVSSRSPALVLGRKQYVLQNHTFCGSRGSWVAPPRLGSDFPLWPSEHGTLGPSDGQIELPACQAPRKLIQEMSFRSPQSPEFQVKERGTHRGKGTEHSALDAEHVCLLLCDSGRPRPLLPEGER